ncbi:MAG: hypothetical protein ACHQIH_01580 [Ignavibacteria bacterium]
MHKLVLVLILLSVLPVTFTVVYSQDNTAPCSSPAASWLDFWVGNWELDWTNAEGKTEKGSNTISKVFGSCVIEENFSTADGTFKGKSLSVFDIRTQTWKQTWVDNTGSYLDFTGGKYGDTIIFSRKIIDKKGNEHSQRMVFYDISKNGFLWNWESSSDNGTTWNLQWKISYKRTS